MLRRDIICPINGADWRGDVGSTFGSALNMNIHFHRLFLDGVYVTSGERLSFRRVPPPTVAALANLVRGISARVGRVLEGQGLLVRDFESSFLAFDPAEVSGFDDLLGHSITYRIALGPHQGRKAFSLQTVPAVAAANDSSSVAKAAGLLRASCPSPAGQPAAVQNRCWRFCLVTRRRGERGRQTREVRAPGPSYHAPGGIN